MTLKEFAQKLNGREYNWPQFTKEDLAIAKENGFIIVSGASDDLMEIDGAINDEGDCFDGGTLKLDIADGKFVDSDEEESFELSPTIGLSPSDKIRSRYSGFVR